MTKRFWKVEQAVLFVLLAGTVLSLSAAAFYNRPLMDDLWQPYEAMAALRDGGTLWDAGKAAFRGMLDSYREWNGVFFSMFLSYLPPMVINYRMAFLHPALIMLLLVGGCFRLAACVGRYEPRIPRRLLRIAAMLLGLMMLLLIYSVSEGVMWYSGAINYTFLFALALYLFAGLFSETIRCAGGGAASPWRLLLLCVGFFLLGGGNFTTSAVSVALYACYLAWLLLRGGRKRLTLPFLFLLAGFCLSVFAPGNQVRQAATGATMPLLQAFGQSFRWALRFVFWDARVWVFALLYLPVAVELTRHLRLEYRHGPLVLLLSLALLAAGVFPSVYATGGKGANRQMNLYFFLLYILAFVNTTYFAGLVRRLLRTGAEKKARGAGAALGWAKRARLGIPTAVWSLALAVMLFFQSSPNFSLKPFQFGCFLPPVKALSYLLDGELKDFAEEYDGIVKTLREKPGQEIVIDSQPWVWLLGGTELSEDPEAWQNIAFAKYYGNEQSRIAYRPEATAHEP